MRLVLIALALAGCTGNARVIDRTSFGGIVVLEGDREKARDIAHREMAAHCGDGRFLVLQEGDEVVGTAPTGEAAVDGGAAPTREITERRMHYRCDEPTEVPPEPQIPE